MNANQLYQIRLEIEGQIQPEYFIKLATWVEVLRARQNPILDVVLAQYDQAFSSYTKHRAQLDALADADFQAKDAAEEPLVITLMVVACQELDTWEALRDLIAQLYANSAAN